MKFTPSMLERPAVSGIDAVSTLRHFAIVTYAVPPERLRSLVHPRFELDRVTLDGHERALLSVVPFEDHDFRAAAFPSPRWRFGQTNYRIYVRDRASGARSVWFLGTTLGSWSVALPRYLWRLPWHHGRFEFDCAQETSGRYSRFTVRTESRWASASIDIEDLGVPPVFPGFPDAETGLVVLTHPLTGYYTRRDGRLGSYAVWHEPLTPSGGRVREARWHLLDRLGIVPFVEQKETHSVLIQASTEFIVRLPPRRVEAPDWIPVRPKNYRRICLRAIEMASAPRVYFNGVEVSDLSDAGPLTQRSLRGCRTFEIFDGSELVLGFHDHPDEMGISVSYVELAYFCAEQGWLKIEVPRSRWR